ncbi:NADH oxidase [Aphelenchoides fujianensis]|nr:NADH oxidase [Aphelenchoides fujianensis]
MPVRVPAVHVEDVSVLGEKLRFGTSKRVAANRFLKAALTERISTWVEGDPKASGIPTQKLLNLYTKWSHGGFGMILTGNVPVDYYHLESAGNMFIDERFGSDERRAKFDDLARAMKSGGEALAVVQLSHAGRLTPEALNPTPYSASDVHLSTKQGLDVDDSTIMCEAIDKKGFDFLELSGGTIEKSAFHHLSDSTKAREAFFLDFAEKIRPSIKSAALYVTGGWRTAKGMIDAIEAGSTQGVGLGRPIAAEPDLPKKILAGRVDSALQSVFEGNFAAGNLAANSQMEQAGLTTLAEAGGDPCYGIMDLSTPEVAAAYIAAQGRYLQEIEALANQGKAIAGVLEYSVTAHT